MKPIYLEPDEEITSVIDKLKELSDHRVAIVVPKNSTLFQSLINLKLLAKEAKGQGKDVAIVSTNRVGQRLAQQVGFQTYNSLGTVAPSEAKPATPSAPESSPTVIDGVKVNQYNPDVPVSASVEADALADEAVVGSAEASGEAPAELVPADAPVTIEEETKISSPASEAEKMPKSAKKATEAAAPLSAEEAPEEDSNKTEPPAEATAPGGELPPIIPRSIHVAAPKEPFKMPWRSVLIGSVIAVFLLLVVYLFLPKATVTLTLAATAVNPTQDITVTTDSPSGADNTIAGNLLQSDQSDKQTIKATGQKDVGTKAGGDITIYNKASSASVTLSSGTTLSAKDKTFSLDKTVTVPGATVSGGSVVPGQVGASITATDVGDSFNLSNVQFAISHQPDLIYGTGSTTGGVTKTVTVLSQDDVDNAVNALKSALSDKAVADLKDKAAKQTVLDGSSWLAVTSQTVDQPVGAQVDSANLSMGVEAGEIAFDKAAAANAIKAVANQDVKKGQELIVPDDKSISLVYKSLNDSKTAMVITATLNGYIVDKLDKTVLTRAIAHHSKNTAISLIKQRYNVLGVKVDFHPGWWPNQLPFLRQAITVDYNFQPASDSATTK